MHNLRFIVIALCLGFAAAANGAVWRDEGAPPSFVQAGGMSLEQAIAMVQSKYGAKSMRANTVQEDGRVVHYIRLMSADRSRVWTVRVDAATGREF